MAKWDNMVLVRKKYVEDHVLTVKYSNTGQDIFTSMSNGAVIVYKNGLTSSSSTLLHQAYLHPKGKKSQIHIPATACTLLSNSTAYQCLVCYTDGNINLFDVDEEKLLDSINEDRQLFNIISHPTEPHFLSVGDDGVIFLYDSATMRCVMEYKPSVTNRLDGHTSRIFSAVFHPVNVTEFISGGWDNTIMFWDLRLAQATRFIGGPHICGDGIDIQSDGQKILTAAYQPDHQVQIWEYNTGKLLSDVNMETFKSQLYCGKWLNENHVIVGGTDPGIVRVISVRNNCTNGYFRHSDGVYSLDFKKLSTSESKTSFPKQSRDISAFRVVFTLDKAVYEADFKIVD